MGDDKAFVGHVVQALEVYSRRKVKDETTEERSTVDACQCYIDRTSDQPLKTRPLSEYSSRRTRRRLVSYFPHLIRRYRGITWKFGESTRRMRNGHTIHSHWTKMRLALISMRHFHSYRKPSTILLPEPHGVHCTLRSSNSSSSSSKHHRFGSQCERLDLEEVRIFFTSKEASPFMENE
jgi:hypothetical protein